MIGSSFIHQNLAKKRQKAFSSGNTQLWKTIRNRVMAEISKRKRDFYADKTRNLSKNDCKRWWDIVNKLSGRCKKSSNIQLIRDEKVLSDSELASTLNTFFTSVNADIPASNSSSIPAYLHLNNDLPTIFPH